jgi:putative ABC transport system ATP-binding protein
MSGGEQQRVALARAIVTDPLMVLADEPTGALDTKNAAMVMEIFEDLQAESRAVVIVTHDLEIAERMDRVVSMRDGKIIADERKDQRHTALADRFWEAGGGSKLE